MDVTREDVLRCARLAHLSLEESEVEPLREGMAQVLNHARSLDELDLEGVPPMLQGLVHALPRREDVVTPSLTQAQALSNAPASAHGQFQVPKVLER